MGPWASVVLYLAMLDSVVGDEEDCEGRVGFFPSLDQCDKYHECRDDKITSHLCPDGLVYDKSNFIAEFQLDSSGTSAKCSYPFSIDCSGRESLQLASPSQGCPRKNGYFSHQDCDKYFFCNDGVANLYPCPGGLVFAPDKGQCTWIEEANRPGCKSNDKFEFSCPEVGPNEHPRYSDPEDCSKFYVCISGSAHHSSCPKGLVFHPESLACDRQEVLTGPCSSWYNKTTVEDLSLPDALPTPATAKPIPTIPDAFINRRRPPMKSKINIEEETNPSMNMKKDGSSPQINLRGRTRVRGSVLRPISQLELQSEAKATSKVVQTQSGREKVVTNSVSSKVEREKENSLKLMNVGDGKKTQPVTRTRTRTRISLSSLPNIVKGEKPVSQSKSRTRVRGRVNIRPTVDIS